MNHQDVLKERLEFILGLYDADDEDGEILDKREEIRLSYPLGTLVIAHLHLYTGFGNHVTSIL